MTSQLAYIGKVIEISPIEGADRIESLTVVCGKGGKWRGVAQKEMFKVGDFCETFLQDSILPATDRFSFMEKHSYKIRMQRFKGVPSEVLIMPLTINGNIGDDITEIIEVKKYSKPIPASFEGETAGLMPSFIPKTDEPNFQRVPELVEYMKGRLYYATEKVDGMSVTVYDYNGHFGVCSRTLEKRRSSSNKLWQIAEKYDLENKMKSTNLALQFELAGPGIQGNKLGLKELTPFLFNIWDIEKQIYFDGNYTLTYAEEIFNFPTVKILDWGNGFNFTDEQLRKMAEGTYDNGKQREGIVIRPLFESRHNNMRVSFKVINLLYKD